MSKRFAFKYQNHTLLMTTPMRLNTLPLYAPQISDFNLFLGAKFSDLIHFLTFRHLEQ